MSEISDNELDEFDAGRDKILLDQAGDYLKQKESDQEDSEEEVLGLRNEEVSESEDEEMDEQGESESEDEDVEGWGSKKNYYGGDDDSDDNEMAEEALRQQKKHLQDLAMDDFVDEDMMKDWSRKAQEHDTQETKHMVVENEDLDLDLLDDEEKMKFLSGSFPEFVPLLTEFNSLAPTLKEFESEKKPTALVSAKIVALRAYLGSISSYFALLAEKLGGTERYTSMKDDPVMEVILLSREVWRQASELAVEETTPATVDEEVPEEEESEEEIPQQPVLTDSEEELEAASEEEPTTEPETEAVPKRRIRKEIPTSLDDYSEQSAIDAGDLLEKNRRKKSLRFYTAKINKASNKSNPDHQFAGDADLPYKERLFERQQRLMEEARKRGLGGKDSMGDDLDGDDFNSGDEQEVANINDMGGEEYYESMKNARDSKKQARRSAHSEAKKAARDGNLAQLAETADENGKRALNFQILKNKGLTPNRKNDNRNARVKKRKKYDAAKKKLKSVRQVYDQNNRGPYQGEKTGIKKGMSRSVKLV